MAAPSRILARSAAMLGIASVGAVGAVAFISVGAGTAGADVKTMPPRPIVTSRQASENSVVRINDMGAARGISEARLGDTHGVVHAQGEVRDSVKAVQGSKSRPFRGVFPVGPSIGEW